MPTNKKVTATKVDKRSKEYRDAQKKLKSSSQKERVIAYVTVPPNGESIKENSAPTHDQRIKELEVHDESTLKLLNELLGRIEKLESIVG